MEAKQIDPRGIYSNEKWLAKLLAQISVGETYPVRRNKGVHVFKDDIPYEFYGYKIVDNKCVTTKQYVKILSQVVSEHEYITVSINDEIYTMHVTDVQFLKLT